MLAHHYTTSSTAEHLSRFLYMLSHTETRELEWSMTEPTFAVQLTLYDALNKFFPKYKTPVDEKVLLGTQMAPPLCIVDYNPSKDWTT